MALTADPFTSVTPSQTLTAWNAATRANFDRANGRRIWSVSSDDSMDDWGTDPATDSSLADLVLIDATGGAVTVDLPPTVASNAGREIAFRKVDAGGNAGTVDTPGSETIDGSASVSLASQWDTAVLVCDGTNWHRIV